MSENRQKYVKYIEPRIAWVPGDKERVTDITIREAQMGDYYAIKNILHTAGKKLDKALRFAPYIVRVAVRNSRYPVGICISEHKPDLNLVQYFWFSRLIPGAKFPRRLLLAAALEQPEVGTELVVPAEDQEMIDVVKSLGWPMRGLGGDEKDGFSNIYRSEPWHPGEEK